MIDKRKVYKEKGVTLIVLIITIIILLILVAVIIGAIVRRKWNSK